MAVTSLIVEPTRRAPLHAVSERDNESPFLLLARWQAFLDVTGKCNAETRKQYRRRITDCWADLSDPVWQGERDPLAVTQRDLVAYISNMDAHGVGRTNYIRAFRSFYGWAWDEGSIGMNPAERLRTKSPKYGPAPSLTEDEMERLLTAAEGLDPRARWAIQLQLSTVCRVGSLLALERRDLRQGGAGGVIHFRVAKGDKPYAVPASKRALEAWDKLASLHDFVPKRGVRRPTLIGVGYRAYERWLKEAGRRADVDVRSHLLRHTAITRLTENAVDTRTIIELANWEDGSLLRRYATASDRNMRAAVDML